MGLHFLLAAPVALLPTEYKQSAAELWRIGGTITSLELPSFLLLFCVQVII